VLRSEREGLARELADTRRKFVAIAKKKQAEYGASMRELEERVGGGGGWAGGGGGGGGVAKGAPWWPRAAGARIWPARRPHLRTHGTGPGPGAGQAGGQLQP
jgi:hypothetical protein